jgi:hypothetical protein
MGIIKEWGPSLWQYLHTLSFSVNQDNKESIRAFFVLLPDILPCSSCSPHLREIYKKLPIPDDLSSTTCSKWVFDVHNAVNADLGKPMYKYKDLLATYFGPKTEDNQCKYGIIIGIVSLTLICLLLVYIFRSSFKQR